MTLEHALEAIKEILAAIPDDELPKPDRVEREDGRSIVWFGGLGHYLGSAKNRPAGGKWKRDPMIHRRNAARQAIELEAVCRLDQNEATK